MNEKGNGIRSKETGEAAELEEEDDFTGYFLDPKANSINMVERIAEANRRLYEEDDTNKENLERPKKVQFSESLINFEPENYESEDVDDSEDEDGKWGCSEESIAERRERTEIVRKELREIRQGENIVDEDQKESTIPEEVEEDGQEKKVLLVMLPREQNSSCESVIGEEIPSETKLNGNMDKAITECPKEETPLPLVGNPMKANRVHTQSPSRISETSLDLDCLRKGGTKHRRPGLKSKKVKKQDQEKKRRSSSLQGEAVEGESTKERSKMAVAKKNCCIVRTGLPQYNGLRSEYGLSAEQLQERKRKTIELRQQRRIDRIKKRQEEIRRRIENEESFRRWLHNKRKRQTLKKPTQVDTLSRSDVYIQTHAVYASRRGVSYSVQCGISRRKNCKKPRMLLLDGKPEKSVVKDYLIALPRMLNTPTRYILKA